MIVKTFLLLQFIYVASVLNPNEITYETINKIIGSFVNIGSTLTPWKRNWINQEILYGSKAKRWLNFIDASTFFKSLKISWIKRYALDRLDDHWADIIDEKMTLRGPKAVSCMISLHFPCIQGFFRVWLDFNTSFHFRPTKMHKVKILKTTEKQEKMN